MAAGTAAHLHVEIDRVGRCNARMRLWLANQLVSFKRRHCTKARAKIVPHLTCSRKTPDYTNPNPCISNWNIVSAALFFLSFSRLLIFHSANSGEQERGLFED